MFVTPQYVAEKNALTTVSKDGSKRYNPMLFKLCQKYGQPEKLDHTWRTVHYFNVKLDEVKLVLNENTRITLANAIKLDDFELQTAGKTSLCVCVYVLMCLLLCSSHD